MCVGKFELADFIQKFRGLADKYINCEKNITVYHYTSIQSLKGIIESGTIYFSSMNVLNDETETYYIWKLINENKEVLFKNKEEDYCKFIGKFFEQVQIDKIVSENIFPDYNLEVYSASFSLNEDSLPIWRGYADGAKLGCCIKFEFKNVIKDFLNSLTENVGFEILDDKYRLALFSAGRIIYDKQKQLKEIDEVLKNFYGFFKNKAICEKFKYLQAKNDYLQDKCFEKFIFDEMYKALRILNIFFKDSCFVTENEYRIIFPTSIYIESPFKVNYRTTDYYLIPYIEAKYPKDSIKEIMLAPINKNTTSRLSIKKFLKDNGINADVTNSSLPLRF